MEVQVKGMEKRKCVGDMLDLVMVGGMVAGCQKILRKKLNHF